MRICFALLFSCLCAAALHAGDAPSYWCVGESTKVKPGDSPSDKNIVWDGASKTTTLGSARNEYVAFQIAVHAGDELKGVTVVPAALKGAGDKQIAPENIELFVEHYLDVKVQSRGDGTHLIPHCTTGEHPTQIVPFGAKKYGAPFDIGAGRNQPVWVDIYVPDDQAPGVYKGIFTVKAGEKELGKVNIELTVWKFALPNTTTFKSFIYTGPENLRWGHHLPPGDLDSDKFKAIENAYFQMAHQHRINFNVSASDAVAEIGGKYFKYYDGTAFTSRVGKGVGQNVLNFGIEAEDEKGIKDYAKKAVALYEEKKFTGFMFGYVWDEPHSDEDFATSKQHCKWIKDATGGKFKTMIATPQWNKYDPGDVSIFSETEAKDIPKVIERQGEVWTVNGAYSGGPYVDSPGFGGRSIPLMSYKMKLSGWQFWDCCYWVDKQNLKHKEGKRWVRNMKQQEIDANPDKYLTKLWEDPLNFDEARKQGYPKSDAIRINGDGLLYYPGYEAGIDGPVASFALKSVRRGMQDYEYLILLKKAGKEKEADEALDTVCMGPDKWAADPDAWEKFRLKLAALLGN